MFLFRKSYDFKNKSDEELVILFQKGNNLAFDEIVKRYQDKVGNYLNQYNLNIEDIKEIVQDSFMNLFKYKHTFDGSKKFSTWFYSVARNVYKRRLSIEEEIIPVSFDEFSIEEIDNLNLNTCEEEDGIGDEEYIKIELLKEAFDKLDRVFKDVILLRFREEMDYEEISNVLKIPIGTVKSRINRGREKVREILSKISPNQSFRNDSKHFF